MDAYDDSMRAFYDEQRMSVAGVWSQHSANRVAISQALRGRDALKADLAALGFELR